MGDATSFIRGAGIGAGLVYFFDPNLGRRRRARLRDRVVRLTHQVNQGTEATLADFSNRVSGITAEMRAHPESEAVDNAILVERVRSRIGRINSHPGAIDVAAQDGQVTLSGPVLSDELERLIAGVRGVPGVRGIVNHLEAHDHPDVSGLQGESHLAHTHSFINANWDPTSRLAIGAIGGILLGYGIGRRGPIGLAGVASGTVLLARAVSNLTFERLFGLETGGPALDHQKILNVNAPLSDVFRLWTNVELFPRFMEHVRRVNVVGPGRSAWELRGPFGIPFRFEAETTSIIPDQEIGWKSIPGATIPNEGTVQFRANPNGSTWVNLRMSYTPPVGWFGHVIATLVGSDPKQLMDEDLLRFKSLLESGKTTAHHHSVELSQLAQRPLGAQPATETPAPP